MATENRGVQMWSRRIINGAFVVGAAVCLVPGSFGLDTAAVTATVVGCAVVSAAALMTSSKAAAWRSSRAADPDQAAALPIVSATEQPAAVALDELRASDEVRRNERAAVDEWLSAMALRRSWQSAEHPTVVRRYDVINAFDVINNSHHGLIRRKAVIRRPVEVETKIRVGKATLEIIGDEAQFTMRSEAGQELDELLVLQANWFKLADAQEEEQQQHVHVANSGI